RSQFDGSLRFNRGDLQLTLNARKADGSPISEPWDQVEVNCVRSDRSFQADNIRLIPHQMNFGHVLSESSITKTFVIDNDAYSRLDIFSVAVTGPGATAYTTSHNCGTSIPGHRRCALDITYNPTALGRDSATLRVETSTRNYGSPEPGVFEVP